MDNYYFIYNYNQNREKSRFYVVTDDKKEVIGIGLNYDNHVIQLRGTEAAILTMLEKLHVANAYLQIPVEHEKIVQDRYPSISSRNKWTIMSIKRGRENVKISTVPIKLNIEDAFEISELMSQTNLERELWIGTVEQVKSRFADSMWLGIRESGKLVSVGAARVNDYGGLIGPIATLTPFRNRGYATSIVSAFVEKIQRIPSTPMISVRNDNLTAFRVYSSIGFELHKSYFFLGPLN